MKKKQNTSWETSSQWYKKIVGKEGHYYHQNVILPRLIPLFELDRFEQPKILDLGCGQGVLERALPKKVEYTGIDLSQSLLDEAKKQALSKQHRFLKGDLTKPLPLKKSDRFTHAIFLLSAQNLEHPGQAIQYASQYLESGAKMILVLNHPCFRIPRQSSWGTDLEKNIQYRRLDHYLKPLKIPIQTHPGKGKKSETSMTYHYPISHWVKWLSNSGLLVSGMEEWCSDKISTGGAARRENRARKEFPLFLSISSIKCL